MRKRAEILAAIIAVMLSVQASGGAELIEVTASVDKQTAYIGDLITYNIAITYDSTVQLTPPAGGANLGGFDVKDYEFGEELKLEDGRRRQELEFKLRTFTTGDYVIPALPIEYILPDSTKKYISADPIKITIKSVLAEGAQADTLDLRPLKGQASLAGRSATLMFVVLAVVVVIAVAVIVYILRRKKGRAEAQYVDPRPSWEIAYADLAVLKERNLPAQGEIKAFYFELSEIMKRYLTKKLEVNAIDMTTLEIGDVLAELSIEEELHHDFMAFFEHADLVKFAKYIPPAERPDEDWDTAYHLITRSKDIVVLPPLPVEPERVVMVKRERAADEDGSELRFAPPELRAMLEGRNESDAPPSGTEEESA